MWVFGGTRAQVEEDKEPKDMYKPHVVQEQEEDPGPLRLEWMKIKEVARSYPKGIWGGIYLYFVKI